MSNPSAWARLRLVQLLLLLSTCLGGSVHAAQTIPLTDDIAVNFTIPAGTFTNAFYFDVPEGTAKFRIDINGTPTSGTDIDLFLRYGQPFPDRNSYDLAPPGADRAFEWLADLSHYQSISFGNEEFMVVSEHSVRPPRAGRWHLAVVNFSTVPINATLRMDLRTTEAPSPATITVRFDLPCNANDGPGCVCDLSGWTDPGAPFPAPGNSGSTRGEQRRIAVTEATRRIAENFKTEAPIVVRACWAELEADANSAVLAQAGPEGVFINDPSLFSSPAAGENPRPSLRQTFLPESSAWYAAAPTSKSGGTSFCRVSGGPCESRVDVSATFNSLIDTPAGLGATSFYYGLQPPPANALDFVGIAMHEITHGLGFSSLIRLSSSASSPAGAELLGRDDIYSRQVLDISAVSPQLLSRMSDSQRLAALVSGTGLQWIGAEAVDSPFNRPRVDEPGVRLFAPNPIRPGSSLSHLDSFYTGELMVPNSNSQLGARSLQLAAPMLDAVGWDPRPRAFPAPIRPFVGQWYDRDRIGHGIDFQRVYTTVDGFDIYSLLFYSYDQNGNPEWFLAIGPMVDGVFLADNNPFDQSLVAYRYQSGRFPPQRADGGRTGQVRLDFNRAIDAAACNDGTAREGVDELAAFTWSIDGQTSSWCMEPLVAAAERSGTDLTGSWYAGAADQGWGASIASAMRPNGQLLFALLYFPDLAGLGRWAFALTEDYQPGQSVPLLQRQGYCRTCAATPLIDSAAGSIVLNLIDPSQENLAAGNNVGFQINYLSSPGGSFERAAATPITLLSAPAPAR